MPTEAQIQHFNECVRALEDAKREYQLALEAYRSSTDCNSQAVDRALTLREIAQCAVKLAEIQMGK